MWEGGKPASWLSMLSTLRHFHGLLFVRRMLDKPPPPNAMCHTRQKAFTETHPLYSIRGHRPTVKSMLKGLNSQVGEVRLGPDTDP